MRVDRSVLTGLPVDDVLDDVVTAADEARRFVLQAPPGAGKTTHVPLALLDRRWLDDRRIVVLEPRRLAARAAARRMSDLLGQTVGTVVGYVTGEEREVSGATRVEVITEGILVRRLQRDPSLAGIAAVILDEFHERSLEADLALAFTREVATALRDDLRLGVMSATLDGHRIAGLLGRTPVVESHGKMFDVETHHLARPAPGSLETAVADAVAGALDAHVDGHVLVFLPGAREIHRTADQLADRGIGGDGEGHTGVLVTPLYGALSPAKQDRALDPPPAGTRKVVLATDIAETSLTIEGVRVVVDSGLRRSPRFDPGTGMSRLETVRISRASAEQRRGRAGRTAPGVCYRLWPRREHHGLDEFGEPEIVQGDLAQFALEVAAWGAGPDELALLDQPPERAYARALRLLERLDAVRARGDTVGVTDHGRELVHLPVHPRLGHMVLAARDDGLAGLAADVAALLSERDVLSMPRGLSHADIGERIRLLRDRHRAPPSGGRLRLGSLRRARRTARRLRRAVGAGDGAGDTRGRGGRDHPSPDDGGRSLDDAGRVLAHAYPDRIGRRREGQRGSFALSNGRGARLPAADVLAGEDHLVAAVVTGGGRQALIRLAAGIDLEVVREVLADHIHVEDVVAWDDQAGDVARVRQERLGELVLTSRILGQPPDAATTEALLDGIRREGLGLLPWTPTLETWRGRVNFLRREVDDSWPDLSDEALLATLEDWLGPFLAGARRRSDLDDVALMDALRAQVGWQRLDELDRLAPERIEVPSGSQIRLDYVSGPVPILAVRVQELFGLARTPAVVDGRVPVVLHLLSPAQRPAQVTRDLAGFWRRTYPEVRRELRGQYPKHHWPTDPLRARPTRSGLPPAG